MTATIPERVEEILNDPWLQPIYDSFISKEDKRTALKTMLTKELTETDQQAREEVKENNWDGHNTERKYQRLLALSTLSNPPSQV